MSKTLNVKFHIFDLEFQPYKEQSGKIGSFSILKSCIKYINDKRKDERSFVIIDRHEKRDKAESRKLFVSSMAFSFPDKMYKCKIHLIRDKSPSFMDRETLSFESVDILKNKEIVETTHFYIDTDKIAHPTIICEYNSVGPKISDIEYYFRYISSKNVIHVSKACKANIHMDKSAEQVMDSLQNIFRFRFRARPEKLPSMYRNTEDSFFSEMQALGNLVDPKTIKVDLSFRDHGGKKVIGETNYKMLTTTKRLLNAVSKDITILEDMEDFYLEYEDNDGEDRNYNFIRGKKSLSINCPLKEGKKGQADSKQMFDLANQEYRTYRYKLKNPEND